MKRIAGVIAATPVPLKRDLTMDLMRLIEHCRWLLDQGGCDGVNLLGTTGEAMSFPAAERMRAMEAVARAGLPLDRIMVGTGAAALEDAVELTAAAMAMGFAGALVVPPFFYKDLSPQMVVGFFERLITRVGEQNLRLYLYHIPQNTGVPFAIEAIAELRTRYPDVVLGLKDSAGDLAYARKVASAFPGFDVFPSSEGSLIEAQASNFAGCISATTNVTGRLSQTAWKQQAEEAGKQACAQAVAIRAVLARLPLVPSVKCALALIKNDAEWVRVHPPFVPLESGQRASVAAAVAPLL